MRHLNALRSVTGVVPVAIPLRAERVSELQALGWESADPVTARVDALIIATDTGRHVCDSQAWGSIPLLIEKPLSSSADSQIHAWSLSKPQAWVACCLRFHPAMRHFRESVQGLAAPYELEIECRSNLAAWRPSRDYRTMYSGRAGEGGALRELIHEVDYAGWIGGWPNPSAVSGRTWSEAILEIADEEFATLEWATSTASVRVELDLVNAETVRRATARDTREIHLDLVAKMVVDDGNVTSFADRSPDEMYIEQARAFVAAASGAPSEDLATIEEGLLALEICDHVRGGATFAHSVPL